MHRRSLAVLGLVSLFAGSACAPATISGPDGNESSATTGGSANGAPTGSSSGGASGRGSGGAAARGSGEGGAGGEGSAGPIETTEGVDIVLERIHPGATTISFGVPVPPGALADVASVRVVIAGSPVAASVSETLPEMNGSGQRVGVRALRVELPANLMSGDALDLRVDWSEPAGPAPAASTPFGSEGVSTQSAATAITTTRTIQSVSGQPTLVEGPKLEKTLFVGREPRIIARFAPGYLASTGILGTQLDRDTTLSSLPGLGFFSEQFSAFADSSMYLESYALNPHAESVTDEIADYSAWLYDRCATYLSAYAHSGELRYLRRAHQSCSHYAGKIGQSGEWAGIFTGKSTPDIKYSHSRGLYAYYALTGDEQALAAGQAIAEMWRDNVTFVKPYREGRTPGPDKLWTERHLATSLEALVYGYQLTGEASYLTALEQMMNTAYIHVTGDAAALAKLNPGVSLPPQNCFIHSGLQQAEEGPTDPWCSPWMSAMLVDPLSEYRRLTDDSRVDEIFVRLGRFLRDVGTAYFTTDLLDDSFMKPGACDDPAAGSNRRRVVPLYGAGLDAGGVRRTFGEWTDFEHCADASLLAAAALSSLEKLGASEQTPIGQFANEAESLSALHQELLSCAERTFAEHTRPKRDPAAWTSAELSAGLGNVAFIDQQRIGFPLHAQMPRRKLSWWFNAAMLQHGLLASASLDVPSVQSGFVQPAGCSN